MKIQNAMTTVETIQTISDEDRILESDISRTRLKGSPGSLTEPQCRRSSTEVIDGLGERVQPEALN
jgi:hypothetical protein